MPVKTGLPTSASWSPGQKGRAAAPDQLTPYIGKGVKGGFSQNLPLTIAKPMFGVASHPCQPPAESKGA